MNFFRPLHFALFLFVLLAGNSIAQIDKVASPRAYNNIEDSQLGTREDDLGVPNGHQVADLVVNNIDGEEVSLAELWSEQPLMVIFYRGGWCPFCNMQIKELADNYFVFEDQNVLPVLISVDKPDVSSVLTQTYDIPFPVLSDQDLVAHSEFNVVNKLTEANIQRAKERGRDYFDWSGRDHQSIAVASSFLVDTDGVVQWSTVLKDYTSRPTKEQLLSAISAWKAAQ